MVLLWALLTCACGPGASPVLDAGREEPEPLDAGLEDAGLTDAGGDAGQSDAGVTCDDGMEACEDGCVDLLSNEEHCGGCGKACASGDRCFVGLCGVCNPGTTQGCYGGPLDTAGIGACKAGTQTCLASAQFGSCQGEVLPRIEICGNGVDEDCNGLVDDVPDEDGDGFTRCTGDCLETSTSGVAPDQVNPAAFEVMANGIDDDCDGVTDDLTPCDVGLTSNSANPVDYARSMGVCKDSPASGWGLVSAEFTHLTGSGVPNEVQKSIRSSFGSNTLPPEGGSMVVLSTGTAAALGQTQPNHAAPEPGTQLGTSSALIADWLEANGNAIPVPAGCPAISSSTGFDPIMLTLKIRVPSNAQAFSLDVFLLTADYPESVCSPFVDPFVALLDSSFSGTPANPGDKNLATSALVPGAVPLSSNLAYGSTGLFTACMNGQTGCGAGATVATMSSCTQTSELQGTGFDMAGAACESNNLAGGGSGWRTLRGNVVPGETITLRLALWDSADATIDTTVLLDNFNWQTTAGATGM